MASEYNRGAQQFFALAAISKLTRLAYEPSDLRLNQFGYGKRLINDTHDLTANTPTPTYYLIDVLPIHLNAVIATPGAWSQHPRRMERGVGGDQLACAGAKEDSLDDSFSNIHPGRRPHAQEVAKRTRFRR